MAAEIGNTEGRRRRKVVSHRPKLPVNESVEVRCLEEGYHGSWHSGIVIACENGLRRIKFNRPFCTNVSRNLTKRIKVPPILDGIIPATRDLCNYRGLIRPKPPRHDFQKCSLHYGLCVDVNYDKAWWEGVIFDNEGGSEVRKILFPDIGDEMQIEIGKLRVTHDWDEFTEDWKPRGKWLFLELVKEIEQHWPLQVSLRQIWYEVQGKKAFQKLAQWTSTNRAIWKDLVWDVIVDNSHVSVHQFFKELELSGDFVQEALPPFSEVNLDDKLRSEAGSGNSLNNATVPPVVGDINLDGFSSMKEDGRKDSNFSSKSNISCNEDTPIQGDLCALYSNSRSRSFPTPGGKFQYYQRRKSLSVWRPAGVDMVPGADVESGQDCPAEPAGISLSRDLVGICEPSIKENKTLQKKIMNCLLPLFQRKGRNAYTQTPKKIKNYRSLIKLRDDLGGEFPACVLQNYRDLINLICPSSFHTSCLGMKDVPDGDWFCPSCCCQICGKSRLNNNAGSFTDVSVLSCDHYHGCCLRERGVPTVGKHLKGSWFCSDRCEKKLLEFGVEGLVLPALPNVLNTWTSSFGFSQMANVERLNFLDCTFLDFEGTVMCQKLPRKIPSMKSRLRIRTQQNIHGVVTRSDGMDLDGNSAVSEAFQADKVEESEMVEQEPSADGGSVTAPLDFELNQPNLEVTPHWSGYKECGSDDNGMFKCYRRRRMFKCYKRRRMSDCRS